MKAKKLTIGAAVSIALLGTGTAIAYPTNSQVVQAATNSQKIKATLIKPRKVILTKNVTILKIKSGKYRYLNKQVAKKTLKKGTSLKVVSGGQTDGWVMFKSGYASSGYGNTSGYYWIVNKKMNDASWFKLA